MHNRIFFSRPRFLLLVLCFAAAASAAYFLPDRGSLAGQRIFCMPAEVSLAVPAAEFALWLAAALTVCALPLFAGLTLWRGACFGLTLALLTDPAAPLNAPDVLPLAGYAAVTLVMLCFAAGAAPHPRSAARFLPCAGMAFGIILMGR